jgi:hypothetical protein
MSETGWRSAWRGLVLAVAIVAASGLAEARGVRLVVADLPYATVWAAAIRALDGYPLERTESGVIATRRVERAAERGEGPYARIAERITLRVEAFGERVTRVSIEVEAEGWRDGAWVALRDTEVQAQRIVERLRAAQG